MRKLILSLLMGFTLTIAAQGQADATATRAEKMFGYLLNNQTDSLYANITLQMKPIMQKSQLEGILAKVEEKSGKYKSHGPWEVNAMAGGSKSCTSVVKFEKEEQGALIVFDPSGFILGIQIVPAKAIRK
jgi:hypothetical protein